jgi:hypothetical protein
MAQKNMSLDSILKSSSSKYLSLRLGPVKLHWFPSHETCLMSTTCENYSFKRNGSVVVITDPEGCVVNIRLKRNGFSFLDMTEVRLLCKKYRVQNMVTFVVYRKLRWMT